MDFRLNDDQRQLRDAVRDFCDNEIAPAGGPARRGAPLRRGAVAKLGAMGLFGSYVPTQYGGTRPRLRRRTSMTVEELSRACGATGILVSAHHSLCVDPILQLRHRGAEAARICRAWPPASGSAASRSPSPAAAAMPARPAAWRSRRTAAGSSTARRTSSPTAARRTSSCFSPSPTRIIPSAACRRSSSRRTRRAVTVGKLEKKLGIKASSTAELIFDNCRIPKDALLGERGKGLTSPSPRSMAGVSASPPRRSAFRRPPLKRSAQYANTRVQFNQPIARFQAIQWKIADMATAIAAARAADLPRGVAQAEQAAIRAEAAMAKLYASEMSTRVTRRGDPGFWRLWLLRGLPGRAPAARRAHHGAL